MEPQIQVQSQHQDRTLWKTILMWTLIGLLLVALFVGGIFYIVIWFIKNSGAYQTTIQTIVSNKTLEQQYGDITFGRVPSGQVHTTLWWWEASLQISIDGSKADGIILSDLVQWADGKREIIYLSSIVDWSKEQILVDRTSK